MNTPSPQAPLQPPRQVERQVLGQATSDGAGVKLTRVLTQPLQQRLDPFLMLDAFGSDEASDYIGGFPNHPHRGFETVTIMLAGRMRHHDSVGNVGLLEPGSVQWMTAGRGIIHSEMPEQEEGRMAGFQLWVNLAAKDKMQAPAYRDVPPADVPAFTLPGSPGQPADGIFSGGASDSMPANTPASGSASASDSTSAGAASKPKASAQSNDSTVHVRVIAGASHGVAGAVTRPTTEPLVLDITLPPGTRFEQALPPTHNAFVYVFGAPVSVSDTVVEPERMAILANHPAADGMRLSTSADATAPSRVLLVAGAPLHEPIVQYGPFVMNTRAEIEQAVADFQRGKLAS